MLHKMGWKRSLPDWRDLKMSAPTSADINNLPPSADLRQWVPEIYNQGETGSCTANSLSNVTRIINKKQGYPDVPPSRLFHYYNERLVEGTVNEDSGAQIRTAVSVAAKYGICPESEWPFDPSKLCSKPPETAYKSAVQDMVKIYFAIDQRLNDFKKCLANGYPFLLGFAVYESFEGNEIAHTGIMKFPNPNERMVGGHAVAAVGYDDATQTFTILNSWSKNWGDAGYFHMPYSFLTNGGFCSDFWTVRSMEVPGDTTRKWVIPT